MEGREQVSYAIDIVIRDQALPLRAVAGHVAFHFLQRADPSEGEQGGQAAVVAHKDVGVQAVSDHDGARWINAKLAGHALKDVAAGLADDERLPLRSSLHGFDKTTSSWQEKRNGTIKRLTWEQAQHRAALEGKKPALRLPQQRGTPVQG